MAACFKCGTTEAEKWRFCSYSREYVCMNCCRSCTFHSRDMLANGTNCRATYYIASSAQQVLMRKFPCSEKALQEAKEYWSRRQPETLPDLLYKAIKKYDASEDAQYRANIRPHLTAMQELIKEGRNGA